MKGNAFGPFAKINGQLKSGAAMRFFLVVNEETGAYAAHTVQDALKCGRGLVDNLEAAGFEDWPNKAKIKEVSPEEFVQTGMTWQGDPCGRSNRRPAAQRSHPGPL